MLKAILIVLAGLVILTILIVGEISKAMATFTDPYSDLKYDQVYDIETIRQEGTIEAQGSGDNG